MATASFHKIFSFVSEVAARGRLEPRWSFALSALVVEDPSVAALDEEEEEDDDEELAAITGATGAGAVSADDIVKLGAAGMPLPAG